MILFNKLKKLFDKPTFDKYPIQPIETTVDLKPISHQKNNNEIRYINVFESYKIKTPNKPIEIENGLINYITSMEENIFSEMLSQEILKAIPDATIRLSLRSKFIINYEIYGQCQICRFQYNKYGKMLQILTADTANWIYVYNIDDALNTIPKIVNYAKNLSEYHLKQRDAIYTKTYSYDDFYINLYFDCCYTLMPNNKNRSHYVNSTDRNQYNKYRERLGADCPETIEEFLNIKYNYQEDWEKLKILYRNIKDHS